MQIALLGDIMIQGLAAEHASRDGGDELVSRIKQVIGSADVAIGNFETFICPPDVPPETEWYSPPEAAEIVARAGFDAVSVVNGHSWDHGEAAIIYTLEKLKSAGVEVYGLGDQSGAEPEGVIIERGGVRIGLLGYCSGSTVLRRPSFTGLAPSKKRLTKDISNLRGGCDVLIVSVHHGYGEYPSPEHRSWAKAAIEAGADAFVSHHSHLISAIEQIGNGVAAYGLGNVVASLNLSRPGNICLRLEIRERKVVDWSYDVFFLDDRGFPEFGNEEERKALREHIEKISKDLARDDYSRFYWSLFSQDDRAKYLRSWKRNIKTYGIKTIFKNIRRIRAHHLRLLWKMLFRH